MSGCSRRTWLKMTAVAAGARLFADEPPPPKPAADAQRGSEDASNGFAGTLRDRFWISVALGDRAMTPAESALSLGVPNVLLAGSPGGPPLGHPFALSLSGFTRVVWPTNGADHVIGAVRPLLAEFPEFTGVLLDGAAPSAPAELHRVKEAIGHTDLWVHVDPESLRAWESAAEPLQRADALVLWPGREERLDPALARLEKLSPAADLLLGCPLQDERQPASLARSRCDVARTWLHSRRIAGLVFGAGTGITGDSDAEEQARLWIGEVGGERL